MSKSGVPPAMKAWTFAEHGEPAEVLSIEKIGVPAPGGGQVLVEVDAAAINFADGLIVRGTYQSRPPLPAVAGMELAGTVVSVGPQVKLPLGTRVAGLGTQNAGAFAEYTVMDLGSIFEPPQQYSPVEAACFSVAYQTAWFAVHVRGQTVTGETVVVHSAAGGVGLASVQLAVAAGATVVGVVGSEAKAELARSAGCAEVVLRGDPDIVARIKRATGGGADVVIDPVGGAAHAVSERVARFGGRIVLVGFASGSVPTVRADLVMVKNISVVGLHWGLYRSEAPTVLANQYDLLRSRVTSASIAPHISRLHDFDHLLEALDDVESGRSTGRVAIEVRKR